VEWLLHDKPVRGFDYLLRPGSLRGELLSTCIVSHYLNEWKVLNVWMDVRDILRTDDNFRDAGVNWQYAAKKTAELVKPAFAHTKIILTQGFIGSTMKTKYTLGREGSDFTAAIFANLLNAESLTIWKDVEGVMSADPKQFSRCPIY